MANKKRKFQGGIRIKPNTEGLQDSGDINVDSADNKLKTKLDGADRSVVTEDQAQTVTNKTIDSANNTITVDADEATVENLEVDNLKAGVLNTDSNFAGATDAQIPSALAVKTALDAQDDASEITYTPADNTDWTADVDPGNVDNALDQLAQRENDHAAATSGVHGTTGEVVGDSDTQTLTNKTITDDSNTIQVKDGIAGFNIHNTGDGTKKVEFDISGSSTGVTTTLAPTSTVNQTIQLPNVNTSDTLVAEDTGQVLTNKTIDSATNTLTIDADDFGTTVSNLEVDNMKPSAIVTEAEGIPANDNDTTLPTSAAVKDYVDSQILTKDEASEIGFDDTNPNVTGANVQAAVDDVANSAAANATDIDDLETLSGSPGAVDHGTFTGSTIPDNSTTKAALQALETQAESVDGSKATRELDNLQNVAINADLLPDTSTSLTDRNIGNFAADKKFGTLFGKTIQLYPSQASGTAHLTLGYYTGDGKTGPRIHAAEEGDRVLIDTNASALIDTADVDITTGDVVFGDTISGDVNITTGQTAGAGNSGDINIQTGTSTSGSRGTITLDASEISANNNKITNVTDPAAAQDAATKAYVDAQVQTKDQASEISFVDTNPNVTGTNVQTALDDVANSAAAAQSTASDHIIDTVDAHDASAISYVNTTSGLTATEVQAAIDEVEGRLDTAETGLSTHTGATSAHGVSGDLVGTSDAQTLTNKSIQGASIEDPSRLDPKKDIEANLTTYAMTAQNGELVYATDTKKFYVVTDGALTEVGGTGGAGAGSVEIDVNQVAHGFSVLDPIVHNGTEWTLAISNSEENLEQYVIVEVTDADNFKASKFGKYAITIPDTASYTGRTASVFGSGIALRVGKNDQNIEKLLTPTPTSNYGPTFAYTSNTLKKMYFTAAVGAGKAVFELDLVTFQATQLFTSLSGLLFIGTAGYYYYSESTNRVYFTGSDDDTSSTYSFDPSNPSGTIAQVTELGFGGTDFLHVDGFGLFFSSGTKLQLWDYVSPSATTIFNDIDGTTSYSPSYLSLATNPNDSTDYLFFRASVSGNSQLYSWDGVAATPTRVFNAVDGVSSYAPSRAIRANTKIYFLSQDSAGRRLYSWDGVSATPTLEISLLGGTTDYANIPTYSQGDLHYDSLNDSVAFNGASLIAPIANTSVYNWDGSVATPYLDSYVQLMPGSDILVEPSLSLGDRYFLSSDVAGQYSTEDNDAGFSSPLFYIEDQNTVHIEAYRPVEIVDTAEDTEVISVARAAYSDLEDLITSSGEIVGSIPAIENNGVVLGSLTIPTSGGEAISSHLDPDKVFKWESIGASSEYDSFGSFLAIPNSHRGNSLTFGADYRTEQTVGSSTDDDYALWLINKTSSVVHHTTSSGSILAGSDISFDSTTGFNLNDKVYVRQINPIDGIVIATITNITATTIQLDQDVDIAASFSSFTTGIIYAASINAADDDVTKNSTRLEVNFDCPADCEEVVYFFQQLTTEDDSFIFIDNIFVKNQELPAGTTDVNILEVITSFDTSSGLTELTSGINGDTFRLTHAAGSTEFAQRDISLDDKWRNKILELVLDVKTTAASGNFKVIVTDETNTKTLADEVITPQDADAKTSKRRFTFSTTPADGDSDIATIRVRFEALAEAGSPTSDFDDIVVQLATTEVREIVAIEQEENVFGARISGGGGITSQSSAFISGVVKTGTGLYTMNFKPGFFSEVPSVVMQADGDDRVVYKTSESTSSITYEIINFADIKLDAAHTVTVTRQGSDYRNLERRVERETSTFHEILSANEEQITEWTDAGAIGIGATTTAPTKGTIVRDTMKWRRVGDSMEIRFDYEHNGGSPAAGSGEYLISIPSGYQIDTSKVTTNNTLADFSSSVGTAWVSNTTSGLADATRHGHIQVYDETQVRVVLKQTGGEVGAFWGVAIAFTTNNVASGRFTVPIAGWEVKPNYTVFEAAPDSKVEIPSSELRMEGMSGKGTGSEATTVQFDAITKLRGDAVTVSNSNGSVFTVQKDGILSVSASARQNVTYSLAISKNAASPASFPSESEIQSIDVNTSNLYTNVSSTFSVKSGDVVRIAMDGSAPSDAGFDFVNVTHQETKVQVAVSNVTPQYEDADSMVRLHTGNGEGTTNTKIRRFASVVDNLGSAITYTDSATDGASFTILEDGYYSISYTDTDSSTGGQSGIGISLNSSELTTSISSITSADRLAFVGLMRTTAGAENGTVSWSGMLSEGDVIRPHFDANIMETAAPLAQFTIAKVGVPSIAEVDVTPFADVNRLERDYFEQTTDSTTFGSSTNDVILNIPSKSETGKVFSVSTDSTNGTQFTMLVDGEITLAGTGSFNSTNQSLVIRRDGATIGRVFNNSATAPRETISRTILGKAGEVFSIGRGGGNPLTMETVSVYASADSRSTMYSIAQTENEFSARISNNGTADIVSQSQDFIESVNRSAIGTVEIVYKSGFFSETPAVTAYLQEAASGFNIASNNTSSSNGVTILTFNEAEAAGVDQDFDIHVSRQGADRKDLQKAIVELSDFPRVNRTIVGSIAVEKAPATLISISGTYGYLPISDSDVSLGEGIFTKTSAGDGVLFLKDAVVNAGFDLIDDNNQHAKIVHLQDVEGGAVVAEYGTITQEQNNVWRSSSVNLKVRAGQVIRFGKTNANIDATIASSRIHMVAQAQELERVTNVDAAENVYSARITNNGTAAIDSQNAEWIQSVLRTSPGTVEITLTPGLFSEAPVVALGAEDNGTSNDISVFVNSSSTSLISIGTGHDGITLTDRDFNIVVQRQGNDYKSIQDVVATVFTPKSAFVAEVQSNTVSSTTSLSAGSFATNTLNNIDGDSDFLSISANQVTLQPGKYAIRATIPIYTNAGAGVVTDMVARLRNITDSSTVKASDGASVRADGNDVNVTKLDLKTQIEITTAKTYEIQTRVSQISGVTVGRVAGVGENEVYTQLDIVKIN